MMFFSQFYVGDNLSFQDFPNLTLGNLMTFLRTMNFCRHPDNLHPQGRCHIPPLKERFPTFLKCI